MVSTQKTLDDAKEIPNDIVDLNCWVSTTSPHRSLSVKIKRSRKIADLKTEIRNAGAPDYNEISADIFRIFKPLKPIPCGVEIHKNTEFEELLASTRLYDVFPLKKPILDGELHIIAEPPACKYRSSVEHYQYIFNPVFC
jgi:hypothetical protein